MLAATQRVLRHQEQGDSAKQGDFLEATTARGCAGAASGEPAGGKQGDSAKGTDIVLGKSSKKSKSSSVTCVDPYEKGKGVSSKTTWR